MGDLAVAYRALGDFPGARDLLEQALAAWPQALGDDHPATLHSMNNLAAVHQDLGDLYSANKLYEHALTARRRILGEDHPTLSPR